MDAFSSLFSVPFQLTTIEAVEQISRVLKPDGVVIFNIGGALEGSSSRFLQAEFATYKKVFPQVFIFKVNPEKEDSQVQNLIMVATKNETPLSFETRDTEISHLLTPSLQAENSRRSTDPDRRTRARRILQFIRPKHPLKKLQKKVKKFV